jgi:hypothetical protein
MSNCVIYILVTMALLLTGTIWIRYRTRQIAASRTGEDFDTFRSSFQTAEVPEDILRAVYAVFQQWTSGEVDHFPVRADDNIATIYGMVGEDLERTVLEIIVTCGRHLLPQRDLDHAPLIMTVRDLVLFINMCPENQRESTR